MTISAKLQVARQYRAVAHLATELAMLCFDMAEMVQSESEPESVINLRGTISHHWMNELGDMLGNVDATDADTARWTTPIYDRAREMFPLERNAVLTQAIGAVASLRARSTPHDQ